MSPLLIALQLITALGIYNVWFLRPHLPSVYRGKHAPTLKQEFLAYGLPHWALYVVGSIKVAAATGLILGLWIPSLIPLSAGVLAVMMLGAISMHIKVQDSFKQTTPALVMLLLSLAIIFLSYNV